MYFFEVPSKQRVLQIAAAIFWCLISAGPIFGFAALKPAMISQGVYAELCPTTSEADSAQDAFVSLLTSVAKKNPADAGGDASPLCAAQDLKLNLMFTIAAALTNICALVIGAVLDNYGPRTCGYISAGFILLSCLTFIYAKAIGNYFDPYVVGYALLALGGPFNYISSFQLSNAFPEKSGLILALITGSFDTSSAVFLVYKKIYEASPSFTLQKFFEVYLVMPVFITLAQLFLMPKESYLTPPPDLIPNPTPEQSRLADAAQQEERRHSDNAAIAAANSPSGSAPSETTQLLNPPMPSAAKRRSSLGDAYKSAYIEEEIDSGTAKDDTYSIFGILHGFPAGYQFRTYWFILCCVYATIQMLRLNYFVATINSQYVYLFHSVKKAGKLNRLFDIALPLGGIVSIPFVGIFLDHFCTAIVLSVLLAVSLVIGLLGLVQNSYVAGVLNVLLFVGFRPFFYTTISDYCAKVFGFETFGTVYGAIMTIAGVFNMLQSELDRLTHTKFKMNPIPVNVFLVALTIIGGGSLVAYVLAQTKIYSEKKKAAKQATAAAAAASA